MGTAGPAGVPGGLARPAGPGGGPPPTGWGGPGWASGPPPASNRRGTPRWVIPLAVVLVVAIGAGSAGLVLLRRSDDGPAGAVRSYLTDVRSAQYDAAYGRLCGSVRNGRSAAEFGVIMRAFDGIRGGVAAFAVRGVQTRHPSAAQTVRDVQVDVQRSRGSTSRESYEVGKENGDYCLLTPGAPFTSDASGDGGTDPRSGPFDRQPGSGGPGGSGGSGGGSGGSSGGLTDDPPARAA